MSTRQEFVDFILEQLQSVEEVTAKKMFGEYGVYSNGKLFGLICDNKLFIKPTSSGRAFIGEVVEAAPYEGAKPSFLIEEKIEDRQWLSELVRLTVNELPEPKAKKTKKKCQAEGKTIRRLHDNGRTATKIHQRGEKPRSNPEGN